ncbi:hypothetical protein HYD52_03900 [Mycoplasmopsis bovis]|nr:hypothetical protein [Mycoplasmopsis bovis]QQH72396.1 hypothetical protein HYD52_03900 [Mycoplasmopsis bovis]
MLYKSINKYQKWWVYFKNKSKHNIGLLYFLMIKRTNNYKLKNCLVECCSEFSYVALSEVSPDLAMYLVLISPDLAMALSLISI